MKSWLAVILSVATIPLFEIVASQQVYTQGIGYLEQVSSPKEKPTENPDFQTAVPQDKKLIFQSLFCGLIHFSPESVLIEESSKDWKVKELFVHNIYSFVILIVIAVLSGFFLGNSYKSCKAELDSSTISLSPRRRYISEKEKQTLFEFMTENKSSPKLAKEKTCQLTIRINCDTSIEPLPNFTLHLPSNSKRAKKQDSSSSDHLLKDSVNKYEKLLQNGHGARNFEVVSMLGRGGFGSVYKARHLLDEQFYAIKVIKIEVGVNQNLYEHKAFREVLSMMQLNSKHVLRYYNCWLESEGEHNIRSHEPTIEDEESDFSESSSSSSSLATISEPYFNLNLNIQMEYSKGSTLKNWLERPERTIERKSNCLIFRQLLKGVLHIHQNNFIHRDLKPANIFIDKDFCVKIGDFGLAVINNYLEAEPLTPLDNAHSTNVGSPLYLAPEQENALNYDEKVDVYPLGMILLELCVKIETDHERYLLLKNLRHKHMLPEEVKEKFGVESQIILWMTEKNPNDRPSVSDIMKSELMQTWESEFQLSPSNHNL